MLLQFAEGTADPFSSASSDFNWYYLSNSGWNVFEEKDIVVDSTEQLLQSGIVRFNITQSESNHSLMPAGLTWLRLIVRNDPALFNDFIAIQTQATTAKFKNHENSLEHLESGLPASSITKLKVKDPAIKVVSQPFVTHGGKAEESDEHFALRTSERLRHKDRAIQIWDYERLVLEEFPNIYKVKCLNHTGKHCAKNFENRIDQDCDCNKNTKTQIQYSELSLVMSP